MATTTKTITVPASGGSYTPETYRIRSYKRLTVNGNFKENRLLTAFLQAKCNPPEWLTGYHQSNVFVELLNADVSEPNTIRQGLGFKVAPNTGGGDPLRLV